ncbi:hypothetical protein AAC387_Pa09g1355 [Persea americana]
MEESYIARLLLTVKKGCPLLTKRIRIAALLYKNRNPHSGPGISAIAAPEKKIVETEGKKIVRRAGGLRFFFPAGPHRAMKNTSGILHPSPESWSPPLPSCLDRISSVAYAVAVEEEDDSDL